MNNFTPDFDLIVIGSGPAAISAGITGVQSGLSVFLISKEIPGADENIPAESIHSGVVSILKRLKALHCLTEASIAIYDGIKIGNEVDPLDPDNDNPFSGVHINRIKFDRSLLQCAIEQGIFAITDQAAVSLLVKDNYVTGIKTGEGREITAKYIVDGSGSKRFAGKKLCFNELFFSQPLISWSGISINIDKNHSIFKNRLASFIYESDGWSWLAPSPPDKCTWTRLSIKKKPFSPPSLLEGFDTTGKVRIANMRWRVFRPTCKPGIILCGDAAGILDPAAGQGILNALYSGMKAAETIVACLRNSDKENFYLQEYDNWFFKNYFEKVNKLALHYREHGINIQ